MKKILALCLLLINPAYADTAKQTEAQTDVICTYHSFVMATTVESMMNGATYEDAALAAMNAFDKIAGEAIMNMLEDSLMTLTEDESYMVGEVTGLAAAFWHKNLTDGKVSGDKAMLFTGSYKACMTGIGESDAASYFLHYRERMKDFLAPKQNIT